MQEHRRMSAIKLSFAVSESSHSAFGLVGMMARLARSDILNALQSRHQDASAE
jgi:hypothetical protein